MFHTLYVVQYYDTISYVKARSMGKEIREKFNYLDEGRIHSIFSDVINIELSSENIVTVGNLDVGNGPYNVIINYSGDFKTVGLNEGELVLINNERLRFVNTNSIIRFNNAVLWCSDWEVSPDMNLFSKNLSYLRRLVIEKGDLRGFGFLLDDLGIEDSVLPNRTVMKVRKKLDEFNERNFSEEGKLEELKELVGLGPGLTPSGDDFISGFLYTINYASDFNLIESFNIKFDEWISFISQKTNKISRMDLFLALNDQPLEVVKNLIESLFGLKKYRVYNSALRLVDRGSTSGTDIITGIIFASELVLKKNLK